MTERSGSPNHWRLLIVYDGVYPASVGGVEHRNQQLALALAERGHNVTLAGWVEPDTTPPTGVSIVPLGPARPLHTRAGRRSRWAALRLAWQTARLDVRGFDVVETASIPLLHLFGLARRCRRAGIPLIVTWHEFWGDYWREYFDPGRFGFGLWRLYRWIERRAARLGKAIAVSPTIATRVAAARRTEVPVVPNGARLDTLADIGTAAGSRSGTFVYAGRLIEHKRIDLLLDALALVESDARLEVIGDGPQRPSLEARAQALGVDRHVEFCGMLPTPEEVWRRIARADCLVIPSEREGFGLTALEAMALGTPVIYCSSPHSAVGDLVRDGVDGVGTEPAPRPLAAAIERFIDDPDLRNRFGEAGRSRATGYDWSEIARRFEATLPLPR